MKRTSWIFRGFLIGLLVGPFYPFLFLRPVKLPGYIFFALIGGLIGLSAGVILRITKRYVSGIAKKQLLYRSSPFVLLAGLLTFAFVSEPEPRYFWIAFGPDAKLRVLVHLDDDAIFLHQYANGKPTGRKERFANPSEVKNVKIADPDGKTSYTIAGLYPLGHQMPGFFVSVDIEGPVAYHQYSSVKATNTTYWAPIARFHGPLTVQVEKIPGLALQRGNQPTDIPAIIGTVNEHQGCWVVAQCQTNDGLRAFPNGVCPFVDVEFPPKYEGDPPIRQRYALDQFC